MATVKEIEEEAAAAGRRRRAAEPEVIGRKAEEGEEAAAARGEEVDGSAECRVPSASRQSLCAALSTPHSRTAL